MTKTKKLLVNYDPQSPDARSKDFLIVVWNQNTPHFLGLKSRALCKLGLLVYVGRDVSANDIFAKLADSGRPIKDVDETVKLIDKYLESLQKFKIGDILSVASDLTAPDAFMLVKAAKERGGEGVHRG